MRPQTMTRVAMSVVGLGLLAISFACSGGSSSTGTNTPAPTSGTTLASFSDASTEDWAQIGVKVLSITLTPKGGGTPVTIYTAPTPAPMVNLCQLDQLSELMGSLTVPVGTYAKATLTIAGNPGDITLVSASNPSAGFPLPGGTAVDPANIIVNNTTGTTGSLTTTVTVNLVDPLVVSANQASAMDLEFDLSHPAFIVEHVPNTGAVTWTVNFNGPVRHQPHYDLTQVILRHMYGAVTSVSSDHASLSIVKDYEVYPVPASGPAPVSSLQSLTIQADAANGTIFYDVDAGTSSVVHDFSAQAGTLAGKFVRVAARHQADGSLVAVRVWASSTWAKVWLSPEGHVNHVNTTTNTVSIDNENGVAVPIQVDANTKFYFRVPSNGLADATPIGTGPGFLANLARGFKVHVGLVDPLAATLTAATVDIEIAKYEGTISKATSAGFTYTRAFANAADSYTMNLAFCSPTAKNGKDAAGNQILGFKWWNFTFPTLADTGTNAIPDFVAAVSGAADFGGTAGAVSAYGMSYAIWGDPANATGWSTKWAVLEPTKLPKGTVSSPWASSANGGSFGMTVANGANPVTVDLSTVTGSATLVYDVVTTGKITTVNPIDITTTAGQTALTTYVVNGATVRVAGVPQPDGTIKCYAMNIIH